MAFNKKSSIQLVKRFQGAFSKMKKNGKYDELLFWGISELDFTNISFINLNKSLTLSFIF